jgi:hypothetical protein
MMAGKKLLQALNGIFGDMNLRMQGASGNPTGADLVKANEPLSEPRGVFGVMDRLNQMSAKNRVAQGAINTSNEKEAQAKAESAAKVQQSNALSGYYDAGVNQREASAKYTEHKMGIEDAGVELNKIKADLLRTKTYGDLTNANIRGQAALMNGEAELRKAEAAAKQAATAEERLTLDREIQGKRIELDKAKSDWQRAVAEQRNTIASQHEGSYGRYVDKAGTMGSNSTSTTEEEIPGYDVTSGATGESTFVPGAGANAFFKMLPNMTDQFGGKSGFLGFGSTPKPTIAPSMKKKSKTTTTTKTPIGASSIAQELPGIPRNKGGKILVKDKTGNPGYVTPPIDESKYTVVK